MIFDHSTDVPSDALSELPPDTPELTQSDAPSVKQSNAPSVEQCNAGYFIDAQTERGRQSPQRELLHHGQ